MYGSLSFTRGRKGWVKVSLGRRRAIWAILIVWDGRCGRAGRVGRVGRVGLVGRVGPGWAGMGRDGPGWAGIGPAGAIGHGHQSHCPIPLLLTLTQPFAYARMKSSEIPEKQPRRVARAGPVWRPALAGGPAARRPRRVSHVCAQCTAAWRWRAALSSAGSLPTHARG